MRKTALAGLLTLLLFFGVIGCDLFGTTTTTSSTTAITTSAATTAQDTTVVSSTTASELEVRLLSIYQLAVSSGAFTGTYEEWLESVRGPAGREIALRVNGGFVQWQYAGETTWRDLIALASLVGPAGQNGQNGQNGLTPAFRVSGTKLQWQYPGEATWTDLFDLSVLTGTSGTDGKEIVLRVDQGSLQWQRQGDASWTTLIDLATLVSQPTISISTDGFWVINGVKTDYPATAQIIPQTVTVTFVANGGTMPEGFQSTLQVPKGDAIDLPIPLKDGYLFRGWITGTGMFDIAYNDYTPFVRNTTLYALWEQDNQGLLAFLAAPEGMNYSGRKHLVVQATVAGSVITFDQTGQMKIMQKNGWTYRTYFDQERDWIEGSWVVRREQQGFEQIQSIEENVMAQAVKFQLYDGVWNLRAEWGQVRNETGFERFDPDLFVKRPGERKYDYPITDEQLILYGVPVGDEVVLSEVECYLDLDLGQIVILLEGQAKMDTQDYHPVSAVLTLSLFDVGTTVVDVPLEPAKEIVSQQIQEWKEIVMSRPQYHVAYPSSKEAFSNVVDGYRMEIDNAIDLMGLLVLCQNAEPTILNFMFEFNFLELQKAQRIEEIRGHLDWQCDRSSADSCAAMRAFFDETKIQIQNAPDTMALQSVVSAIYDGIRNRFVEDPAAAELAKHKQRLMDFVDVYQETLLPYFPDHSVRMIVSQMVGEAKWKMDNAASKEEADAAYEAFYVSLVQLDVVWGDWSPAKLFLLSQIEPWGTWIDRLVLNGYPVPANAKADFELAYQELAQYNSLIPMIHRAIEVYTEHETALMPFVRQWGVQEIQRIRNEVLPKVPSPQLMEFEQLVVQMTQKIQGAQGPWDVQAAIDELNQYVATIPVDDWQNLVQGSIQALQTTVDILMQESLTLASKQAIANLFVLAQEAILKIPNGQTDQLNLAVERWNQAIHRAILPFTLVDPEQALEDLKNQKREFVDELHRYAVLALAQGQSTTAIDNWRTNFMAGIAAATNESQVHAAMSDLISTWVNLNLTYQADLTWLRYEFLQEIETIAQSGLMYLPEFSSNMASTMNGIRQNIEDETNPVYLIMSGVSAKDILTSMVLFDVRMRFLSLLEESKNNWANWVRSDALIVLYRWEEITQAKMNLALTSDEIAALLYQFPDTASLLPRDEFKLARQSAVNQYQNHYAQLLSLATEDSRAAMALLVEDAIDLIMASQTFEELNMRFYAAKQALYNVYVLDESLWQLQIYREYYREIGQRITESVMFYANQEEFDHLMMMSYYVLVDTLALDDDPADMYLHYRDWVLYLVTLHSDFVKPLSDLLPELNSALWAEIDGILSHGLAGEAVVVNLAVEWSTILFDSASEIEAIANRHMAYYSVLDKAYVVLYERAVLSLTTLYGHYQAVLQPESQPLLDEYFQAALQGLLTNSNRFDHAPVIDWFVQQAQTLP